MTEIDVPDWVVEQAFNAWCDVADVDEWRVRNSHEALRAALSAALGALVVPACYRLHQPNHSSEWISGMYGGPPMNHKAWSVEQTFTLRQEKPE